MDSFKIIKPKYSKTQRNLFAVINLLLWLSIGTLTLWIIDEFLKEITTVSSITIILKFIIAISTAIFLFIIEIKIINGYTTVGNLCFLENELSISILEYPKINYKDIKIIYLSALLAYGRGGFIAINFQLISHDNKRIDIPIIYKSDSIKRKCFQLNIKKDIFDLIKEKKIKYKWIRKKI